MVCTTCEQQVTPAEMASHDCPEPAVDPKQQAIAAAAGALLVPVALIEDRLATPSSRSGQLARIAVEAAWDLLASENHALRVKLADLEHHLGQGDRNTGQAREQVERLLNQPHCPECGEPLEANDRMVFAFSTSYRVHEECGSGSDRAGINLLRQTQDAVTDLREALSGCLAALAGDAPSHAAFAEAERRGRQILDETGGGS